jgi:hypothetical protein
MQETIPQHNYRLDAAALEAKRFGEVSCRDYREAIIRNLPHSWGQLSDTHMHEAHFAKHRKARNGGRTAGGAKNAEVSDAKTKRDGTTGGEGVPGAGGAGGPVTGVYMPPNALVAHTQEGLTAVNLFSGVDTVLLCCCAVVRRRQTGGKSQLRLLQPVGTSVDGCAMHAEECS